jgi:hypothetical protein
MPIPLAPPAFTKPIPENSNTPFRFVNFSQSMLGKMGASAATSVELARIR